MEKNKYYQVIINSKTLYLIRRNIVQFTEKKQITEG